MLIFRYLFWAFARVMFSFRYRVRIHGWDQLQDLDGATLILPNHPAYVDPMLVLLMMWPKLKPRPLLNETMFQSPLAYPFMKLVNAVRLPDLQRASAKARARAEGAIQDLIDGLKAGENYLMWPGGRAERQGTEILGGTRALTEVLKAVPDANIVRLRTRGLWGSRFSYAYTGDAPQFGTQFRKSFGWWLAGLLFFMPRRQVTMTLDRVDRAELPELERAKVNAFFEKWYNEVESDEEPTPEKPTFVPYHLLFGPRDHEYPKFCGLVEVDPSQITEQTRDDVTKILEEKLKRPLAESENKPNMPLIEIGLDSLDRMEITLDVERHFGFSGDDAPQTVGQLWMLGQGLAAKGPPKPPPEGWFTPRKEGRPQILADNLLAAFVARAQANPKDIAVADDMSGALNYERLLIGALIMAKRFRTVEVPNVGLLMPASAASDIAFFGLLLAGKLPVILNWTSGPANLAHAAKLLELTDVVTSNAFIDRTNIQVEGTKYLCLEDVREEVGTWEKISTLLNARFRRGWVRGQMPKIDANQPAVVLFTSGSEKAPKAVPLTHRNIISNQRAGIKALELSYNDSVLGFLPAFHSFGLTITGVMPLLGGVRVVRHPDPTDAHALVRKIDTYKPTLLLATPTFLRHIFERAEPGQLDSLRLIIVGAEKCPQELFDSCKKLAPNADLLEGYGITECSPVVAVNLPDAKKKGTVGKPLPGVDLRVIDLETEDAVATGKQGMLLVGGPTVFPGYIGGENEDPFKEDNGKRWYVTGDLVEIDNDGFVKFAGRLKRFLKSGGEMISLPALEEPFQEKYPPDEETGPRVAVEGVETESRARIVLFTTEDIELANANGILKEAGFGGVMRLDEVRKVDAIPLLGTGKVDYKVLRKEIAGEIERS